MTGPLPAWTAIALCVLGHWGCAASRRFLAEAPNASCRAVVAEIRQQPRWIRTAEARDRARHDEWCAAVGPVLYEEANARIVAPSDRLAIVSWNVHMGRGDLLAFADALRSGQLTGGEAEDDFVLLLQETYRMGPEVPAVLPDNRALGRALELPRDAAAHDVRSLAAALNLFVAYVPSMRNGPDRVDRGNAILSTRRLSHLLAIELPLERQRRTALAAAVDGVAPSGTPWRLNVASVHLDTAPALLRGGPAAARRRQALALVDALASLAAPVALGGDLNTSWGSDEPAFRVLRAAFPDATTVDTAPTWKGPLAASARLDHLFVRWRKPTRGGAPIVRRVPARYGSDHHPLVTVVRFD
jgi:endonuclease/exonuclease/phosphatase family metal-dependent hydrolase